MERKDFVIDKVSWHTKKIRNYEFDPAIIYEYFKSLITYLQKNSLTTRIILTENETVQEETEIRVSDLTEEGYELLKLAHGKWIDKVVDGKISSSKYTILDNALKKIRAKKPLTK